VLNCVFLTAMAYSSFCTIRFRLGRRWGMEGLHDKRSPESPVQACGLVKAGEALRLV